jgi:hypothetical protein
MAELLVDAKLAADRARAGGADRVDGQARTRLHARYQRLLADGLAANPPPPISGRRRGRPRRSSAGSCSPGSTPIRMRSFGGWRTLASAAAFLALESYVTTARKHGMNPLVVLHQLFEGRPWLPARAGV